MPPKSEPRSARRLRPIFVIAMLTALAGSALRPMIAYRALELGADIAELGILASSHVALALVGGLFIGRGVDRLGARRFLVVAGLLISISALGAWTAGSIPFLVVAQAVLGLGQTIALIASQGVIADHASDERRDAEFGTYAFATSVGQLLGPAGSGLIAGAFATSQVTTSNPNEAPVLLVGAGVGVLLVIISARFSETPMSLAGGRIANQQAVKTTLRAVVGRPQMLKAMIASVAVVLSLNLLMIYMPALGSANGLSVELVGLLLSVRAAGSMVSRLLIGRLVRTTGRGAALAASMTVAAFMLALLPMVTSALVLLPVMFLLGIGLGLGGPMTMAWVAGGAALGQRTTALGIRLTGNRIGQLVLPTALGVVAGSAGIQAMFWTLAAMLAIGAGVVSRARFESVTDIDR